MRWIRGSRPGIYVPDGVATACAEIPGFEWLMGLVRLARWWNVWIGASAAVISAMGLFIFYLIRPEEDPQGKRFLLLSVSAVLVVAGVTAWWIGKGLTRVVAHEPWKLRPRLLVGALGNVLFLFPLGLYLVIFVLDAAGKVAGPGFGVWQTVIMFGAFASPALGVFANAVPWLRLGRAYDNAVVGYVSEDA